MSVRDLQMKCPDIISSSHEPMVTLSSTKEARIYNGKKITSLTSGVGKIGQPLVKE